MTPQVTNNFSVPPRSLSEDEEKTPEREMRVSAAAKRILSSHAQPVTEFFKRSSPYIVQLNEKNQKISSYISDQFSYFNDASKEINLNFGDDLSLELLFQSSDLDLRELRLDLDQVKNLAKVAAYYRCSRVVGQCDEALNTLVIEPDLFNVDFPFFRRNVSFPCFNGEMDCFVTSTLVDLVRQDKENFTDTAKQFVALCQEHGTPIIHLFFEHRHPTDEELIECLNLCPDVQAMISRSRLITDKIGPHLANLTSLSSLRLSNSKITDQIVPHLSKLPNLELVHFGHATHNYKLSNQLLILDALKKLPKPPRSMVV